MCSYEGTEKNRLSERQGCRHISPAIRAVRFHWEQNCHPSFLFCRRPRITWRPGGVDNLDGTDRRAVVDIIVCGDVERLPRQTVEHEVVPFRRRDDQTGIHVTRAGVLHAYEPELRYLVERRGVDGVYAAPVRVAAEKVHVDIVGCEI